jgi:hypothetical protein
MLKLLSAIVGLALGIAAVGCASPTRPSGPASLVTFTYHSVAPNGTSGAAGACAIASLDPRPRLTVSWRVVGLPLQPDASDPTLWSVTDLAPVGQPLEVSLRDPGLCRLSSPPPGYFVSSGLLVNDVPLRHVEFDEEQGGTPCFTFSLTVDGRVFEDQ